jgi:hypothetical protein
VPTAVTACRRNPISKIGVINDPPPTPVMPTAKPTTNPEATKGSENNVMREFTVLTAAHPKNAPRTPASARIIA